MKKPLSRTIAERDQKQKLETDKSLHSSAPAHPTLSPWLSQSLPRER
jgi:hypothetical protein